MARRIKSLAFLDTHIVVWLYDALEDKFTSEAKEALNACELKISSLVLLELQYLHEIGRISQKPQTIVSSLEKSIGVEVLATDMKKVVALSMDASWTRDPFDRLLTAEAAYYDAAFITSDRVIREHYPLSIW